MFRRGPKTGYIRVTFKAGAWKKVPMKLLRWGRKMPSTTQYNLVPNDEYDTRIPLHPDEAFEYGITFHAKYIGTMDVPRPTSRVEIVAAMRRVRYEFKARGVKKRKVTVDVSIDGVRVSTNKNIKNRYLNLRFLRDAAKRSKFFGRNKKTQSECIEIMHHPIYRIFYVSHDSSDLKIFSYIARDGATNVFKCNVFKSTKKSQAMRIVRTVGQAFEVCHKMQNNKLDNPAPSTSSAPDDIRPAPSKQPASKEAASECGASQSGGASTSKGLDEPKAASSRPKHLDLLPPPPKKEGKRSNQPTSVPSINLPDLPECITKIEALGVSDKGSTPLSAQHQLQLLRERLEQQTQQTRAAVAQLLLLRDQLAAEQSARCEAQARTHQLLVHNKELLEHIAALVAHLHEKEKGNSRPISAQQLTLLPQKKTAGKEPTKTENGAAFNGNCQAFDSDELIDFFAQNDKIKNVQNNNINLTSFSLSPQDNITGDSSPTNFGNMTNEQIQNYLICKFQDMAFTNDEKKQNNNKQFFQNQNAFPHIPLLNSQFSNSDLVNLLNDRSFQEKIDSSNDFEALAQAMSIGHSQNSLYSTSQPTTSKDSSPDDVSSDSGSLPFIMPLSHNGTLAATGNDGRVRLIVPISPSESISDVGGSSKADVENKNAGTTLKVPGSECLAPGAPITRSTSEKVPNRSEMMTALRSQWTRHTTK